MLRPTVVKIGPTDNIVQGKYIVEVFSLQDDGADGIRRHLIEHDLVGGDPCSQQYLIVKLDAGRIEIVDARSSSRT
jgi:hypothetical protein